MQHMIGRYVSVAAYGAATALVLAIAPRAYGADGPYVAAGYSYTGYETRCNGGACDRRDSGYRAAVGWHFAKFWSIEAIHLDAGRFVASDVTASGTPFHGNAKVRASGGTVGYEYPIGTAFTIAARVGAAAVTADFEPGPAPAIRGGKSTTQFFGGLTGTYHFSNAWSVRLDWDHTRGRMNRYDGDVNGASVGIQFGF
jgi:hypothetical protein